MSNVVTVIQARVGSTRLPGKVLMSLGHGTVLDVLLQRVRAARLAGTIVVATTTAPADDAIEAAAVRIGVDCFRGDATDLLDRHYRAATERGASDVVKIPSDCPLIDPRVIDDVIGTYLQQREHLDYASNLQPPSHPDGNDVEIMRMDTLAAAWREATRPFEREHTTPYIWNRPGRFRLLNVVWEGQPDRSRSHRVVLDYAPDYAVIREVYTALAAVNPVFSALDVVRFLDANPQVMKRNAAYRGVAWYSTHIHELPGLAARPPI